MRTATELIRQDLEPILAELFVVTDNAGRYLRTSFDEHDMRTTQRSYFMWLNYGLLGSMIAFVLAVLWWLL